MLLDTFKMSPFHLACEGGEAEMVRLLLDKLRQGGEDEAAVRDLRRGSANFLARQHNHEAVVELLESLRSSAAALAEPPPCWRTYKGVNSTLSLSLSEPSSDESADESAALSSGTWPPPPSLSLSGLESVRSSAAALAPPAPGPAAACCCCCLHCAPTPAIAD